MRVLDQATVTTNYTNTATISDVLGSAGGSWLIVGGSCYAALQYGVRGQTAWTNDFPIATSGNLQPGTAGIRFKLRNANIAATVSAVLSERAEPSIELSSSGQIPSGGVNVQVNSSTIGTEAGLNLEAPTGADLTLTGTDDPANARVNVALYAHTFNPCAPPYNAVGDGIADDTAAILAARAAWLAAGRGTLYVPPLPYKITGPITIQPATDQVRQLVIEAYGSSFLLSSATAGWIFQPTANTSWRNLVVNGLGCQIGNAALTDAILCTDGGAHQGFFFDFVFRDCTVEGGLGASNPVCNGLHLTGTSTGVFQFDIDNFESTLTSNVTGTGLLVDGTAAGTSSIKIRNPNITGYQYCAQIGTSAVPFSSGHIDGGTLLNAQNEGLRMFSHGGSVIGTHIENNWLSALSRAAAGGGLYWEGWGEIISLEDARDTGSKRQQFAVDAYPTGGPLVVVGRSYTIIDPNTSLPIPWLRVRSTGTDKSGRIVTEGLQSSQIDFSAVVSGSGAPGLVFNDFSGVGSPETVVAAPIGTRYDRFDGGAGTSLYVKESGAGNTGWVGK